MDFISPENLITAFGLIGVAVVLFVETGLFFGFFLPGDSLLLTAGVYASKGIFPLWLLILVGTIAVILGDNVGYQSGKRAGSWWFKKPDSFFFKHGYIERAMHFYRRFGVLTIVVARVVPLVRTFAPIVAGIVGMKYRTFFISNVVGGVLWVAGLSIVGFILGNHFPGIEKYAGGFFIVVVVMSFAWTLLMPFIFKDSHSSHTK